LTLFLLWGKTWWASGCDESAHLGNMPEIQLPKLRGAKSEWMLHFAAFPRTEAEIVQSCHSIL
jgi:hypothetical protein